MQYMSNVLYIKTILILIFFKCMYMFCYKQYPLGRFFIPGNSQLYSITTTEQFG